MYSLLNAFFSLIVCGHHLRLSLTHISVDNLAALQQVYPSTSATNAKNTNAERVAHAFISIFIEYQKKKAELKF